MLMGPCLMPIGSWPVAVLGVGGPLLWLTMRALSWLRLMVAPLGGLEAFMARSYGVC